MAVIKDKEYYDGRYATLNDKGKRHIKSRLRKYRVPHFYEQMKEYIETVAADHTYETMKVGIIFDWGDEGYFIEESYPMTMKPEHFKLLKLVD